MKLFGLGGEGKQHLRPAISNTGWLMGSQVIRQGTALLIGILMARSFGPALFGKYTYASAFVALFAPLVVLGLDGIAIRDLARDPSNRDTVLGTSFGLMLASGVVVFCLALGGWQLLRGADPVMVQLVGIMSAALLFQSFNAIEFWLESRLAWKYSAIAKGTTVLLCCFVKIGLIFANASLVAFAWTGLAEAAAGAAGLVIAYGRLGLSLRKWRFTRGMATRLLRDSWPMMFSAFATMIYLRIDQVMLGIMATNTEVGLYAAAVRISEASGFIPMAICSSLLPVIAETGVVENEEYLARQQKLYNLMAFISYGIAIPTTLLSGWLALTLFGPAYGKAGPLLALLVWGSLFTNLGTARTVHMISRNRTRANLFCLLAGGIVNVLLNYWLIPSLGALGAVVASLVSYWFAVHGACIFIPSMCGTGWMLTKAIFYPKVW